MKPLSKTDIEEQLSIAYTHAVCARAAMCWQQQGRLPDNRGIDGLIRGWRPFGADDGYLKQVEVEVQLKATKKSPVETKTHFSYFLDSISQYDSLREPNLGTPRILVVLFLPQSIDNWLIHSHGSLILQKCAYWVSLRGAIPVTKFAGKVKKPTGKTCLYT